MDKPSKPPFKEFKAEKSEIDKVLSKISFANEIEPVSDMIGGTKEALRKLDYFIKIFLFCFKHPGEHHNKKQKENSQGD